LGISHHSSLHRHVREKKNKRGGGSLDVQLKLERRESDASLRGGLPETPIGGRIRQSLWRITTSEEGRKRTKKYAGFMTPHFTPSEDRGKKRENVRRLRGRRCTGNGKPSTNSRTPMGSK